MKKTFYLALPLVLLLSTACEKDLPEKWGVTETIAPFGSQLTGGEYEIDVLLPPGYSESGEYPAVYLLDGDWYFDNVARKVGKAIEAGELPACVLVGVGYTGSPDEGRFRDYTFPAAADLEWDYTTGGGDEFLAFMAQELLPHIAGRYAVDTAQTILLGHSLGGLQVMYSFFQEPDTPFSGYVAASPSIWWEDGIPFAWEEELALHVTQLPRSLYLTYGDEESASIFVTTAEMADRLASRNYQGFRLGSKRYRHASHGQTPTASFLDGLKFILN